jgi:hypothetical protein
VPGEQRDEHLLNEIQDLLTRISGLGSRSSQERIADLGLHDRQQSLDQPL